MDRFVLTTTIRCGCEMVCSDRCNDTVAMKISRRDNQDVAASSLRRIRPSRLRQRCRGFVSVSTLMLTGATFASAFPINVHHERRLKATTGSTKPTWAIFSRGINGEQVEVPPLHSLTAPTTTSTTTIPAVDRDRVQPTMEVVRPTFQSIEIEDYVDPEFVEHKKRNENYDNDFDSKAFLVMSPAILAHSCVVSYERGGVAVPFMTSFESDSTWIEYTDDDDGVVSPAGPVGQLKETVANFCKEPRVEVAVAFAVLISCALVALSTVENMPYKDELYLSENFISAVFAVDFFGRWFSSSKDRGRHILDAQFALDVVVVLVPLVFCLVPDIDKLSLPLPDWMTSPSALINLESLRVLRLRRVFRDMNTYVKYERALGIRKSNVQEWQLQLARVLLSLFTLVSVSTGLIYTAEHDVNPAIPDFFTAAYFSLSTICTLGIGDITPVTWQGRLVVCISILAGVAILPAQAAALVEALVARRESLANLRKSGRTSASNKNTLQTDNNRLTGVNNGKSDDDRTRSRMVLETSYPCPGCGASMHWSSARFCWSCGESLPVR